MTGIVKRHNESRDDEEECEDDGDRKAAPDTPCLHPADGRTHRPDNEKSNDEHQEDRPKPDHQPQAGHNKDELDHRHWRYLKAHHTLFLVRGGLVFGERRNADRTGLDFFFHVSFLRFPS